MRGFGTSKELSSNLQVVTDDTQKSFLDETVLNYARDINTPKEQKFFFLTNPYGKLNFTLRGPIDSPHQS